MNGRPNLDLALYSLQHHPEAVEKIVLIDAQGFIEGAPSLPDPLARVGIEV